MLFLLMSMWAQVASHEGQHISAQPPALLAAEKHRTFINTRVEWTSERWTPRGPSLIRGRAQYTKDEFVFVNDFGLIPSKAGPKQIVQQTLFYDNQYWNNQDHSVLTVRVRDENKFHYFDIRAIGMCASAKFPRSVADALWRPLRLDRPRTYKTERKGKYHVVTALIAENPAGPPGRNEHRWWIDPSRGWSVVRCQHLIDGVLEREVLSSLRQYGEVWFLDSVAFFHRRFEGGKRPYATIKIDSALFDDPSLPHRLTPKDIGVEVGTNVTYIDADGKGTLYGWDGQNIAPFRAVAGQMKRGEIEFGAKVREQLRDAEAHAAARARAEGRTGTVFELGLANINSHPSEWDRYVLRFIHTYTLDADQIQSAWRIHADCRNRADQHLVSRREDFAELYRRERSLDAQSDTRDRTDQLKAIAQARARLVEPVRVIFESLKARLEKLLTRNQREQGEGGP